MSLFGFSKRLQRWVMHTWGKSILFFLGIKIYRNEIPENKNFILMPNHRSYIDIFIVAALTPAAMVGKAELKKWPLGKLGVKVTSSILVDRSEIKSLVHTMKEIKELCRYSETPQGIPADMYLIAQVKKHHCLLVTNDTFSDWKLREKWVEDNIGYYRIKFMINGDVVLLPHMEKFDKGQ